jgi:glutathione S-transferase
LTLPFLRTQINRRIIPSFDCLLTTSLPDKQSSLTAALQSAITDLVNASHITGPFFLGPTISFVDVVFAPWIIRLSRVLKFYRQWPDPEVGTRWERWVQAVERDDRVRGTVSDEVAYHRVYERASKGGLATASVDWEVSNGVVVDAAGGAGAGKVI